MKMFGYVVSFLFWLSIGLNLNMYSRYSEAKDLWGNEVRVCENYDGRFECGTMTIAEYAKKFYSDNK